MRIFPTKTRVDHGEFPRLHCEECDWPWWMHQQSAPKIVRINHDFAIPADILEAANE